MKSTEILSKSLEITDGIREHIASKLDAVHSFFPNWHHLNVTLERNHLEYTASFRCKIKELQAHTRASDLDLYIAIDEGIRRLERILRKHRERIVNHRPRSHADSFVTLSHLEELETIESINREIEADTTNAPYKLYAPPKIHKEEQVPIKTLSFNEAMLKIDLEGTPFLLFRSEEDQKLKLLSRNDEGGYSLLHPEM